MPIFGGTSVLFDLLEKQANAASEAIDMLQTLIADGSQSDAIARSLKALESDADAATHEVTHRTDEQFITPFDKEDIHSLTIALDDVIDMIEAAGARIVIYRLGDERRELAPLASALRDAVTAMAEAVHELRNLRKHQEFAKVLKRVHERENQTDAAYREALGRLFAPESRDPITVIKFKDIIDHMEIAADKCEDVAVFLEKVSVKYA